MVLRVGMKGFARNAAIAANDYVYLAHTLPQCVPESHHRFFGAVALVLFMGVGSYVLVRASLHSDREVRTAVTIV